MDKNKYIGSDFDAFLSEQGELENATASAVKRVTAWQCREQLNWAHNAQHLVDQQCTTVLDDGDELRAFRFDT